MTRIELTAGDTEPLSYTVTDEHGAVVALETTALVTFVMGPVPQSGLLIPVINAPGVLIDAPTGRVQYVWGAGETGSPGIYLAQFIIAQSTGVRAYPTDSLSVVIYRRAGS